MIYIAMLLLSVTASSAVRLSSASAAIGKADQHQKRQQRNYGLLGNLIAAVAERAFGPSTVNSTPAVQTSEKAEALTPPPSMQEATSKAVRVSPLKGVRELVRMLWSNFLPDPTFEHAIKGLKQRDKQLGMYHAAGEGGYITAAEKARLLSQSGPLM